MRVALVVLLALAAFCRAFDWNWCRPLIQHYVMSRSGRAFAFDDLQVHWRDGLDPTIEFRGLEIQNAPWAASKEPFIRARHIAVTLSWRSLGADVKVIRMIEMEDAQVDMERLANGIRNWRITRPDDTGPPRVRVLALDARDSRLHTIHRGMDLDLQAQTTPLSAPRTLATHAGLPLTKRLVFNGTYKGHAFEGDMALSDVLTFGATPRVFALQGTARMGALKLEAAGVSNDVHALGDIDVDATLSTEQGGTIWPLPEAVARARPLAAQGRIAHSGERWTGSDVHVRAGKHTSAIVDAVFTGSFKSDTPRRALQATVRDAVVDVDDVAAAREKTATEGPLLSTQALPFERLRELDADVDLHPARIAGAEHGLVQGVRAHATLANGLLKLQALDASVADGHVVGTLQVDASRAPADIALDLDAHGLHIDQLSPKLAANGALSGVVDGHAVLKSRGDSTRALVKAASGDVALSLAEGASVSKRLDAKLGLNGGEWLRTLFDKSARVPVQCGAATLAIARGVATPRRFVFETPDTALAVRGSIDLGDETLDATLTPARKKLALLALDKSIHAEGAWHDVKIALVPASGDPPERCAR